MGKEEDALSFESVLGETLMQSNLMGIAFHSSKHKSSLIELENLLLG